MRQIDPQSLLLGEVWEDASNKRAYGVSRRYFVDGELDSVMNYPWRNAIVAFLTDADDGTALGESLMTLAENYPPEVLSCVMNHLGTHDTPRILTVLGEPFRGTKDERAHRRMTPVQRKDRPDAAAHGGLPAVYPARYALHLLRRRGRDGGL